MGLSSNREKKGLDVSADGQESIADASIPVSNRKLAVKAKLELVVEEVIRPWAKILQRLDPDATVLIGGSYKKDVGKLTKHADLDLIVISERLQDPETYIACLRDLRAQAMRLQTKNKAGVSFGSSEDYRKLFYTEALSNKEELGLLEVTSIHFLYYPDFVTYCRREKYLGDSLLKGTEVIIKPDLPEGLPGDGYKEVTDSQWIFNLAEKDINQEKDGASHGSNIGGYAEEVREWEKPPYEHLSQDEANECYAKNAKKVLYAGYRWDVEKAIANLILNRGISDPGVLNDAYSKFLYKCLRTSEVEDVNKILEELDPADQYGLQEGFDRLLEYADSEEEGIEDEMLVPALRLLELLDDQDVGSYNSGKMSVLPARVKNQEENDMNSSEIGALVRNALRAGDGVERKNAFLGLRAGSVDAMKELERVLEGNDPWLKRRALELFGEKELSEHLPLEKIYPLLEDEDLAVCCYSAHLLLKAKEEVKEAALKLGKFRDHHAYGIRWGFAREVLNALGGNL